MYDVDTACWRFSSVRHGILLAAVPAPGDRPRSASFGTLGIHQADRRRHPDASGKYICVNQRRTDRVVVVTATVPEGKLVQRPEATPGGGRLMPEQDGAEAGCSHRPLRAHSTTKLGI
jgi:hypothetical protein